MCTYQVFASAAACRGFPSFLINRTILPAVLFFFFFFSIHGYRFGTLIVQDMVWKALIAYCGSRKIYSTTIFMDAYLLSAFIKPMVGHKLLDYAHILWLYSNTSIDWTLSNGLQVSNQIDLYIKLH